MLKNQLYPYIEKYINEYLYGFSKEKMNLAIIEGKIELEKLNIRPDSINKKMDEINIPFWTKAGLINKIYIGCSLMNFIGEVPLEIGIEGINIILCPSYKWINKNMNNLPLNEYIQKNPLGLDLNNTDNLEVKFDISVFNKEKIDEIFKDKTFISNIVNSLLKRLLDFYKMTNLAVNLKVNKMHIRIEDDELFNYEDNFVLGIKIDNLIAKLGFKGNTKKNSIKIENFSVYWETNPKIIISNEFLNNSILSGKLDDEYYKLIKEIDFESIGDDYNNNLKLIIDNFNLSINFGTKSSEAKDNSDIFGMQNISKKCYFQISSNELIVDIYPEFLKAINHFSSFSSSFSVIEKIMDYRPNKKPRKNLNKFSFEEKKNIVKNWLHYFIWRHKILHKQNKLIENPIRAEFNRFYNIYHKKANIFELMEKIKEKKNENEEDEKNKEENNKENSAKNEITKISISENEKKETEYSNEEIYTFEQYISLYGGNKNSNTSKENYQNYVDKMLKKKYQNFSSTIEILIKSFILNLHPSLNRNVDIKNNLVINTSGIDIKIEVSPEQFNFNFGFLSLDIGPRDVFYGERVILKPTTYRANLVQDNIPIINKDLSFEDNNINAYQELRKDDAGLAGLIKKYNPNHEQKMKVIDDAINKIEHGNKIKLLKNNNKFYIGRYNNEYSITNNNNTTLRDKSNSILKSNSSFFNNNLNFKIGKSNATMFSNNEGRNKPRNSSTFAKTIIENFNEADLRLKQKLKKQKDEINISKAINNYNSNLTYKRINTPIKNIRYNNILNSSYSNMKFKSKTKFNYILKNNNNNKYKSPLNLLEVYSNSQIEALKIKYIKYNNSFSLDDFSIQIGTIRLHPFPQYIVDIISIILDYKTETPQIKRSNIKSSDGRGMEGKKKLFELRKQLYEILLNLNNIEKTESIKEYINYLKNEIQKLQIFIKDNDTYPFFELNCLFSFFPKGIKIYFDYENIECVYYNKMQKMLGKFMISPYTINISISLSQIIANIFGFTFEINNLLESQKLIEKMSEQCKKMLENKKSMVKLIIEPCYESIKGELVNEGIFDENILKNQNDIKKIWIKKHAK